MWSEINKQSGVAATLSAEAAAAYERVSALETRIGTLETWRNTHEISTVTAITRLEMAVDALAKKLEDRMSFEKSRWEKIWQVAQPILLAAILAFVAARSAHP